MSEYLATLNTGTRLKRPDVLTAQQADHHFIFY